MFFQDSSFRPSALLATYVLSSDLSGCSRFGRGGRWNEIVVLSSRNMPDHHSFGHRTN